MKLRPILLLLLLVCALQLQAQRPAPDQLATKKGAVTIQPVQHGSVVLTWDKKIVYVDPAGGTNLFSGLPDPDLILITDIHGDHFDLKTLEGLNTAKARFIVPQAVADKMPATMKAKVVVLNNGGQATHMGIAVRAIPMYNLPEEPESRHPKGRGNGYVVTFADKQVYFSGDTEDIPEMRALQQIDVAFVCMNLPYTMDVNQAAQGVLAFKPKVVYPYHYRGPGGLSDVESFKAQVTAGNPKIEVRLRNWYPGS